MYKGEEGDNTAYNAVECKVVKTQYVQNNTRGVERNEQSHQHAGVKGCRVFGNAAFVLKFRHKKCVVYCAVLLLLC